MSAKWSPADGPPVSAEQDVDRLEAVEKDLRGQLAEAQAACAAMRQLAQFLFVMRFGELPEVLTREMESVDFERFGNIIKAPHPW